MLTRVAREEVRLVEVEGGDRGAILRISVACSPGAQAHVDIAPDRPVDEFDKIASRDPIFRVTAPAQVAA